MSPILPRPLVYAHRGGAALRPENTLAAFDHGLTLGADGLELDVRLSRDGDGGRAPRRDARIGRPTGRGRRRAARRRNSRTVDAGFRVRARTEERLRGSGANRNPASTCADSAAVSAASGPAGRYPIERRVVVHDHRPVARQPHIELEAVGAEVRPWSKAARVFSGSSAAHQR